jgi:hypothetical protein
MAFASTYPAAKAALIATWDAAVSVPVINGPTIGFGSDGAVTVGYQDENNPVVAEGSWDPQQIYGRKPEREQYTINCAVGVQSGSTSIAAVEAAALALWAALGAALEANFTLGGAVMGAGIDQFQLVETQDTSGAEVIIKFGVAVDAFTTV